MSADDFESEECLRLLMVSVDSLLARIDRQPDSEAKRTALTRIWDRLREMRDDDGTDTE